MNSALQLTDVQFLNQLILNAIRVAILQDPIAASYVFNLAPEVTRKLATISQEKLSALIEHNEHEMLFVPRANFANALDLPLELLPAFLTVQEHSAAPDAAARADRRKNRLVAQEA